MGKSDADEKARQKRRQKKIERNRRKRKKKLANRRKSYGSPMRPGTPKSPKVTKKRVKESRERLRFYREKAELSQGLIAKQFKNEVQFPTSFSLIENPNSTLKTIGELVQTCSRRKRGRVILDQRKCERIDYGAQSLVSMIIKAGAQGLRNKIEGAFPENDLLRKTVYATGLPKELDLDPLPEFEHYPLQTGRKNIDRGHTSSSKEKETANFVAHIDKCLERQGYALSRKGKSYLGGLVSEVIGNAEDHSQRDEWWIGGYMYDPGENERGDCYFTVFNLGQTIYQSLRGLPADAELRKEIDTLVEKHTFFFASRTTYGRPQLETLYALQQGVSRFKTGCESVAADRGQGTVDMITHFQQLGQTDEKGVEPQMCLISGDTYIRFDENYDMQESKDSRKIIAFNSDNDLRHPPDRRNVRKLNWFFPGTVISGRFYIDPRYLSRENGGYYESN